MPNTINFSQNTIHKVGLEKNAKSRESNQLISLILDCSKVNCDYKISLSSFNLTQAP